jgi:hypothetical protein
MFTFPKLPEAIASVRDTVQAPDPWGFDMRFEILRADHEDCRKWDEAHPESSFASLQIHGALMHQVGAGGGASQQAELISQVAGKLEQRSGAELFQGDLERGKRKAAMVVIRSWSGIFVNGVEVPYDPMVALALLGFRGYAWREKNSPAWIVKTASEFEKMGDNATVREVKKLLDGKPSKVLEAATKFTGEHRGADGEVIVIPRVATVQGKPIALPHGGYPLGQALTLFIHSQSMEASAALAKAENGDVEVFPPTPDTARDSGGENVSSASNSPSEPSEASLPVTDQPAA